MNSKHYTKDIKVRTVIEVNEDYYSASEQARKLGVTTSTINNWIKRYSDIYNWHKSEMQKDEEIRKLKLELQEESKYADLGRKTSLIMEEYFAIE